MPETYATVATFFENPDAYAAFLKRVTARLVEWAIDERENIPASPSGADAARQAFAIQVLTGPTGATIQAKRLLPALAVRANAAGLVDSDGAITATDAQILATVNDAFIDLHAGYVPEVA